MVLYQNTFEKKTYKHDDSPNSVSTLRGSYCRCKGQCLIKMLALGAGIFPLNFRVKWLLWTVDMRFDCAGSHKVCVRALGWFWGVAFFSDFFRVYTHTHVIHTVHTWSYIMCTLCTHIYIYIYIYTLFAQQQHCQVKSPHRNCWRTTWWKVWWFLGSIWSLKVTTTSWVDDNLKRCRFRAMGLFSAVN